MSSRRSRYVLEHQQSYVDPTVITVTQSSWMRRLCLCSFLVCCKPCLDESHHVFPDEGLNDVLRDTFHVIKDMIPSRDVDDPFGESVGRIRVGVRYDANRKTLIVMIIRATNLAPPKTLRGDDTYVKVVLLPNKKKRSTALKGRTLNPVWNEFLDFERVSSKTLERGTLFLQVRDYDRSNTCEPLGEAYVTLSDLNLPKGEVLWKSLMPSKITDTLGELYLDVCYDGMTSRLDVNVVKARNLIGKDRKLPDVYVKVWLRNNGEYVEKRRTSLINNNDNPYYNETLTFYIGSDIEDTSLAVSVMNLKNYGRNEIIGQILLGKNYHLSSGPEEIRHWQNIVNNPGEYVRQCHVLKKLS